MSLPRIAGALLIGAALLAPSARAETVKVAYSGPGANYLGLFAGIEKGFFKQEGIDNVELQVASGAASTPALMAGDVDFTFSASVAIGAILKGAHLKVVFVTGQQPGYEIWATPAVKSLADLKDKQLGIIARGDTSEIATRIYLAKHNLPADYLAYTPLGIGGNRLAGVMSGAVPASILLVNESQNMRKANEQRIHYLAAMKDDVQMVFSGVATTDALMGKNPDLVRRFLRGVQKGFAYGKAHRDEGIDITAKYSNWKRDEDEGDYDLDINTFLTDGIIAQSVMTNELNARADMLEMDRGKLPATAGVFDMSFAQKAADGIKSENWKP